MGTVYAYATADGKALWQFDIAREFETVNGVPPGGRSTLQGRSGRGHVRAVRLFDLGIGIRGNVVLAFSVP